MRNSKQRELVYQAVCVHLCHPSADYIYTVLKKDHPTLSLATVYRNLNRLSQKGLVHKIEVPNGSDRFDANTTTHFHAHCEECEMVFDVGMERAEQIHAMIMGLNDDIHINGYNLLVHCVCTKCSTKDTVAV